MTKINIAIVEDHKIVMEGLILLLGQSEQINIVGGFSDADTFLNSFHALNIDLAIVDIILGDKNGLDVCKEIKKAKPNVNVLILSNMTERSIVLQALENGANGYLIKNTSSEKLLEAIQTINSGDMYFSPEITAIIAKASINKEKELPSLTKRELEILKLIATGSTSQAIASQLFISAFTVETHRRNLMQKFKVHNMAELIMEAVQQKLL